MRSSEALGSSVSSACAVIKIPGVQKPHCSAKCLRNAACTGEAQIVPQAISQRGAWFYLYLDLPTIDRECNVHCKSSVFTAGASQSPFHKGGEQSTSVTACAMNVVGWIDDL